MNLVPLQATLPLRLRRGNRRLEHERQVRAAEVRRVQLERDYRYLERRMADRLRASSPDPVVIKVRSASGR